MAYKPQTPFDSIESSHEYVALLAETIEEVRLDVDSEIVRAAEERKSSRKEALQLVSHNLSKLSTHILSSRRILNDLQFLRCALLAEGEASTHTPRAVMGGIEEQREVKIEYAVAVPQGFKN